MNLGKLLDYIIALAAVAAGTSVQNGTAIDMQGWDGVLFICHFGAITSTGVQGLKAQQGAASNGSDGVDLEGSLVSVTDAQSNTLAVLDVYRPQDRYVRPVVNRATANAVINGVIAIRYKGRKAPITLSASVAASKFLNSPAEGTA